MKHGHRDDGRVFFVLPIFSDIICLNGTPKPPALPVAGALRAVV